jgi:hypothetical protein
MGRFITAHSRIEQTDKPGYWRTLDNELYMTDNCELLLAPRFLWSDGYTFPGLVMAILGDHHYFDARCAHQHDLFCRFHQRVRVELSLAQLKMNGYLHTFEGKVVCEDIPLEYLNIEKVSKTWTDNTFYDMMISCGISKIKAMLIRFGVFFNLNWYLKTGKKSILEYNIYEEDIGLVNGL